MNYFIDDNLKNYRIKYQTEKSYKLKTRRVTEK